MFPLAQTVGHCVYVPGAKNSHGNPVDTWLPPVDVQVYGYGAATESTEPGGTRVIEGLEVFAPVFPVDSRDRFVVDGKLYDVDGDPSNWDKGPFGFEPGQSFRLIRVEGGR